MSENLFEKKMVRWNENEIIFTDNPNVGIAGIPSNMPDGLAVEIIRRWNGYNGDLATAKQWSAKLYNACLDAENYITQDETTHGRKFRVVNVLRKVILEYEEAI